MDLGTIQDALADFATFGKNIGPALKGIPENLTAALTFVNNFEALSSVTEGNVDDAEQAGSTLFGSSND